MLYGKLRCTEYLEFVAGLWGVDGRIAEKKGEDLLRWLDLWEARGNYCENLSQRHAAEADPGRRADPRAGAADPR